MRIAWLVLAAGCMTPYRPGDIATDRTVAAYRRYGCVDVGLAVTRLPEATGPIVVFDLGDRCDHSATVDLSAVRVVAHDLQGETVPMVAYDPERQIRPMRIGGRDSGEEWIEYNPVSSIELMSIEVELGNIVPSAPQDAQPIALAAP
jgi:hypothetical protein